MPSFPVTSDDCLIVRAFRDNATLRQAAKQLNCDPSALVRKAQRISAEHGLLLKVGGKWTITERGMAIVRWTEEGILSQQIAINARAIVRIATTMWLSERMIVPNLPLLAENALANFDWVISTPTASFDEEILSGKCDFALACHPPLDPAIATKRVATESWVVVAPSAWKRKIHNSTKEELVGFLAAKPFIRHSHLSPLSILGAVPIRESAHVQLDHLIGVRAAVVGGLGWSCVPQLLVQKEIDAGAVTLIEALPSKVSANLFLLWYRDRKDLQNLAKTLGEWATNAASK